MKQKLAIIVALPHEIARMVRGIQPHTTFEGRGILLYQLPHAIVVAGGMGAHRATLAFEAARAVAPIEHVISAGLAGACTYALGSGDVAEAGTVIASRTGERYAIEAVEPPHILVSTDEIAGITEKARLAATYGAAMVDMEAATVGRLALAHGLSFRAIKGISDGHKFELPSLAGFADHNGHFRTRDFAVHTALRPHTWGKAMKLGRASNHALKKLHTRLRDAMDEAS